MVLGDKPQAYGVLLHPSSYNLRPHSLPFLKPEIRDNNSQQRFPHILLGKVMGSQR